MESARAFPGDVSVDVLVVGAGPAGYMAAVTLARYGVDFRIIDQRAETIRGGQASGIQPRTQEVWKTLDLQDTLDHRGNHVSEHAFWVANPSGKLERTHVGRECIHPTPYPWILAVPQPETEKVFDSDLNTRGHQVDRPTQLLQYSYTEDPDYPIHALVKHRFTNITSEYRCKYLIGSDGAGSVIRKLLGITSDRSDPDDVWAVADMELETDFPDHRRRCHIRSPAGAMMLIPSATGLNRIYTQLTPTEVAGLGGVDRFQLGKSDAILMQTEWNDTELLKILKTRMNDVLSSYTTNIKTLHWVSQYRIRQRIIDAFDDGRRVFLAGDACHTQSPKAAQGLNISMMDAYNLTWKIAGVLQGTLQGSVLCTYNTERLQMAQDIVGFDRRVAQLYVNKEFQDDKSQKEFQREYYAAHGITAGVGNQYSPNLLIDPEVSAKINSDSSEPLTPGKRLLTPSVTRHMDGQTLNLLDDLPSNGRFHIFIFAGHVFSNSNLSSHFASLAAHFRSTSSPLTRYSHSSALSIKNSSKEWAFENTRRTAAQNLGRTVDLFLIHTDDYYAHSIASLPSPFPDWKYRIYADQEGKGHADLGVDPAVGAMALVRPDGYVGLLTGLDGGAKITEFLDSFMVVAEKQVNGTNRIGHMKENGCVHTYAGDAVPFQATEAASQLGVKV
ncbi:MAG: hypothetical protein Q9217_003928 [Psora testacea]